MGKVFLEQTRERKDYRVDRQTGGLARCGSRGWRTSRHDSDSAGSWQTNVFAGARGGRRERTMPSKVSMERQPACRWPDGIISLSGVDCYLTIAAAGNSRPLI